MTTSNRDVTACQTHPTVHISYILYHYIYFIYIICLQFRNGMNFRVCHADINGVIICILKTKLSLGVRSLSIPTGISSGLRSEARAKVCFQSFLCLGVSGMIILPLLLLGNRKFSICCGLLAVGTESTVNTKWLNYQDLITKLYLFHEGSNLEGKVDHLHEISSLILSAGVWVCVCERVSVETLGTLDCSWWAGLHFA